MSYGQWLWMAQALSARETEQAERVMSVVRSTLEASFLMAKDMIVKLAGLHVGAKTFGHNIPEDAPDSVRQAIIENASDDAFIPLTMWLAGPEFVAARYKDHAAIQATSGSTGEALDEVADALRKAYTTPEFRELNKKVWDTTYAEVSGKPIPGSAEFDTMLRRLGVQVAQDAPLPSWEGGALQDPSLWGDSPLNASDALAPGVPPPAPMLKEITDPETQEGTFYKARPKIRPESSIAPEDASDDKGKAEIRAKPRTAKPESRSGRSKNSKPKKR